MLFFIVLHVLLALPITASVVDYIPQSFFFDWNNPNELVPVPVTTQCETISISWSRTSGATGPDPVAPYYLQIYTSRFVFPFVIPAGNGPSFDFQVPFAPGTLYQICMVDKNGNSGGCQDIYTVIPSMSEPSCSNVSFPLGPLDVSAVQSSGPLSQYGWINQCTDIGITPNNGTPPYTITIAPTLHPPYNITIDDQSQTNWTVSLSWASSFFIGVSDSEGNSWANGPLHSGGGQGTSSECLAENSSSTESTSIAIPIGAGVGGLAVGLIAGIGSAVIIMRRRQRRTKRHYHHSYSLDEQHASYVTPFDSNQHRLTSTSTRPLLATDSSPSPHHRHHSNLGGDYMVEPFTLPGEHGQITSPTSQSHEVASQGGSSGSRTGAVGGGGGQIYVVHHDSQRPPVTVYHQPGTSVVELPPQYDQEQLDARSRSDATRVASPTSSAQADPGEHAFHPLHQQRRPDQLRRKAHPSSQTGSEPSG